LIKVGVTEPQWRQKQRWPFAEEAKQSIWSSPLNHLKPINGAPTKVANAAPWCLRHIEQWQWTIMLNGPLT
jgi:hypothetical protein